MLGGGFGVAWTSGIFSGVMAPARALNLFSVWMIQSEGHGRNDNTYLKAYLPLRSLSLSLSLALPLFPLQQHSLATPTTGGIGRCRFVR